MARAGHLVLSKISVAWTAQITWTTQQSSTLGINPEAAIARIGLPTVAQTNNRFKVRLRVSTLDYFC